MKKVSTTRFHVIVVGGSMVGCVTAALLARRFEHVTVIDRDELSVHPAERPGVPQARHVHVLLARGAKELERLFPGLRKQMADAGARFLDTGADVAWLTPQGWGARYDSGLPLYCATRDFLEWHVRSCTRALANVRFVEAANVTGLITQGDTQHVAGVRVRHLSGPSESVPAEVTGNLVVDASGRESRLPVWLAELGIGQVPETRVDPSLVYVSQFWRIPDAALPGCRAVFIQAALPQDPRGAVLFPVEGNRWHVTLLGYGAAAPPFNPEGFIPFARTLRNPIVAEILARSTPLSEPVGYKRTENRMRHFDRMKDWPEGLVAVGDSVCAFDPVYGQGMTSGTLSALALETCVEADWDPHVGAPPGFARRTQRTIARTVRPAWDLATGEDLRLPTTTGARLKGRDRWMQRYFDLVVRVSTVDVPTRARLLDVMGMVKGPETLLHPSVFAAVLRHLWSGRHEPSSKPTARPQVSNSGERAVA